MSWKGFLQESKSYMSYPQCGCIKFWLRYPIAWWRFNRLMNNDSKLKGEQK